MKKTQSILTFFLVSILLFSCTDGLTDLQEKASLLQLNDWLFSQLIRQGLQAIYKKQAGDPIVEYATFFLLAKSGYDVRLTYRDKLLQVNGFIGSELQCQMYVLCIA